MCLKLGSRSTHIDIGDNAPAHEDIVAAAASNAAKYRQRKAKSGGVSRIFCRRTGAGGGNRTRVVSLEGWRSFLGNSLSDQ
jgi:hypothetical protein